MTCVGCGVVGDRISTRLTQAEILLPREEIWLLTLPSQRGLQCIEMLSYADIPHAHTQKSLFCCKTSFLAFYSAGQSRERLRECDESYILIKRRWTYLLQCFLGVCFWKCFINKNMLFLHIAFIPQTYFLSPLPMTISFFFFWGCS